MQFDIKGKADHVSKEEIRAILHATDAMLSFHNKFPVKRSNKGARDAFEVECDITGFSRGWFTPATTVTLTLTDEDLGVCEKSESGKAKAVGTAWWKEARMKVKKNLKYDSMFTVIIHEMIHLYFWFHSHKTEVCTSTLTARLKPYIADMMNILVEDTYKRAGYIAHCKLSYAKDAHRNGDHYNKDQYHKDFEKSKGKKFRKD